MLIFFQIQLASNDIVTIDDVIDSEINLSKITQLNSNADIIQMFNATHENKKTENREIFSDCESVDNQLTFSVFFRECQFSQQRESRCMCEQSFIFICISINSCLQKSHTANVNNAIKKNHFAKIRYRHITSLISNVNRSG